MNICHCHAGPWFIPYMSNSSVMAGRTGEIRETGTTKGFVYLPCNAGKLALFPKFRTKKVDIVYLCYPNNPQEQQLANRS